MAFVNSIEGRRAANVVGLVVGLVLVLFAVSSAEAQTLLRWKFEKGQKLNVQFEQQIDTETTFSNKPVKMSVQVSMAMTWLVDSIEASGEARIEQTFDQIAIKMTVPPGTTVEYDSAGGKKPTGEAKELASLVAPLIGARFVAVFDPRGRIVDVTTSAETLAALAQAGGGDGQSFFSKERIGQLLRQSSAVLPEKEVTIGDRWEDTSSSDTPLGKLQQTSTYVYEGKESRGVAQLEKIRVESKLELPPAAGDAKGPTLKRQNLSGMIYFDGVAGRAVDSQIVQSMTTETKVRDNVVAATVVSTLKTRFVAP